MTQTVPLLRLKNEEPAKVCGNCIHGSRQGFTILRGRAAFVLRESSEELLKAGPEFLGSRMVQALENLAKVYAWRARCEREKIQVGMFERGCHSWLPR